MKYSGGRMKTINSTSKTKNDDEIQTNWFTRRQASLYLQISISNLDSRLPIKRYYLNKSVRYFKKDLDDYLLSHCFEPRQKGEKE
jgi:hypothetical protein